MLFAPISNKLLGLWDHFPDYSDTHVPNNLYQRLITVCTLLSKRIFLCSAHKKGGAIMKAFVLEISR